MNRQKGLELYMWLWTIALLIAALIGVLVSGEGLAVFENLRLILFSPSKLITDYFNLGSLGATFLNAALTGLVCNLAILIFKPKVNGTLLAGYFLVIAHCFYGLNVINMWPPFVGVILFALLYTSRLKKLWKLGLHNTSDLLAPKEAIAKYLYIAMFATSLGPFISDFLFRYTIGDRFVFGEVHLSVWGMVIALVFGLVAGLVIPALLQGTAKMHRGHNLYKAGLAIGLFGMFAYAFFYKVFNVPTPDPLVRDNPFYTAHENSYLLFVSIFFAVIFITSFLVGFFMNGRSMKGYSALLNCDGLKDDFLEKFGLPVTLINVGLYGMAILIYFMLVTTLAEGAGFTGPTCGIIIAAITFVAAGQSPKNVWPIILGHLLLYLTVFAISRIFRAPIAWTVSTQEYMNGLAFATGLCPIVGRYGWKWGIVAGVLDAILCTLTASMHGGFVLYNGGLTAGLTALFLISIFDFYKIRSVGNDETANL